MVYDIFIYIYHKNQPFMWVNIPYMDSMSYSAIVFSASIKAPFSVCLKHFQQKKGGPNGPGKKISRSEAMTEERRNACVPQKVILANPHQKGFSAKFNGKTEFQALHRKVS